MVEHHLAKVGVAGSNPVVRSMSAGVSAPLSSSRVTLRVVTPTSAERFVSGLLLQVEHAEWVVGQFE